MAALKTRNNSLAGLTLDAVLGGENAPLETQRARKTLLDIIREEQLEGDNKDRTTWKTFREKLRLKRTGAAWSSSHYIPFADIVIPETKQHRKNHRHRTHSDDDDDDDSSIRLSDLLSAVPMSDPPGSSRRAMFTRGSSMRAGSAKDPDDYADVSMPGDGPPSGSLRPQSSRHDSVRDHGDGHDEIARRQPVVTFVEERTMSARDAVATQEAAAADEDKEDDSGETEEKPAVMMSLMDLLEETDRQMGLTGSRYAMDEEEEEEEEEDDDCNEEGDFDCCMCGVKIKGAAFTPCGHTFCKLCSKELMVQRGHCPVCTSFLVEFLEIF
ncbi:PREDICTED: uncharacterized protein LOC104822500 [Tarenaya hassleriana]|uniref:uncharacterized protein LOC104822500 n=1 Tax=Tarenaya hassleriana TaxID=28532 RepID=UPI00053C0AE8|nr:PREDICTED: uncharacterized protein LOC104822500 [Tarenaya hassleriana]XP_010552052.1 PREDICTED: uncharacterized protein LOC104822500 [Tarenaya hassleriana]